MLFALAAFAIQTIRPYQPVLPSGCSPELSQAVRKVALLTEKSDFVGARAALRLLPSNDLKIEWDDSGAPKASRYDFVQEREAVLRGWLKSAPGFNFSLVKSGPDLRVVFVPAAGLQLTWSEDPLQPRLTAKIGLREGTDAIDPAAVYNDFSFAIGSFMGIAKLPMAGFVMSGLDSSSQAVGISTMETGIAIGNTEVCRKIRDQVLRSFPVDSTLPALALDIQEIKRGPVLQGTPIEMKFRVKNVGGGKLSFKIVPDCSCFSTHGTQSLEPSESGEAWSGMNTREFNGLVNPVRHNLYLFTNDGSNPIRTIPVEVVITPRYRILPTRTLMIADSDKAKIEAYMFFPPDHPLTVTSADSQGLPGDVTFEPWSGTMADPDVGEGPMPRKGYKFTLKLHSIPDGMQVGTNISMVTDDQGFEQILYPVFVQRGIIALPPSLFMGEVGAAPRKMSFLLTRSGKGFGIKSLGTDSKHIHATYAPTDSVGEYRITVVYDGQADAGDYHATVTVVTDDPVQKVIDIAVTGTIR